MKQVQEYKIHIGLRPEFEKGERKESGSLISEDPTKRDRSQSPARMRSILGRRSREGRVFLEPNKSMGHCSCVRRERIELSVGKEESPSLNA